MNWSFSPTNSFYKFCAVTGLIIMLAPMATLTWLFVYTEDLVGKIQLSSASIRIDVWHQELLSKLEENSSEPSSIEERKRRIGEEIANTTALRKTLAKQNADIKKANRYLGYVIVVGIPVVILYLVGWALAIFGFKYWYKFQLSNGTKS